MIELTNVRAVAWDMDGTMLNSLGVLYAVTEEVCAEMGRDLPDMAVFKQNFHGSLDESLQAILGVQTEAELADVLTHFLNFQEKHYEDLDRHLFKDAIDLSLRAAAASIPQIVITNRAHKGRGLASPRSIVARSLLAGHIDEIRCGDEGTYNKPDPRVLDGWLEKHGVQSSRLLIVGDQNVDAKLALSLGARAVLVQREDEEIHHLDQLPPGWEEHVTIVHSLHAVQLS